MWVRVSERMNEWVNKWVSNQIAVWATKRGSIQVKESN